MAKVTKDKETKVEDAAVVDTANTPMSFDELMASFSDAERSELTELSGQAANAGYDKIPILKINYNDLADVNGNKIETGRWVILQDTTKVEVEVVDEDGDKSTEIRVADVGVDLGKSPKITIYCFGSMYSFYDENDKDNNCRSQLVFDPNKEKHVGNNLPYECRSGKCPRRAKECAKDDKCGAQWVIFCNVTLPDGEKIDAILYAKGTSYIPFSDFIKELGTMPIQFAPVKLSTKMEISAQGKPYFVQGFKFMKDTPFARIECMANVDKAKDVKAGAQNNNAKHKPALESKGSAGSKPAQIVDKTSGSGAIDVSTIEDDDITFG